MDNKLIPLEVKRRQTPVRLIKNLASLAFVSIYNQGLKKLDEQETNIAISIINTALHKYNEKNNHPFSAEEMKKIQSKIN